MLRGTFVSLLLACVCASSYANELLRENIKNRFIRAHNHLRSERNLRDFSWSIYLAAKANVNALQLAAVCHTNTISNGEDLNIRQAWGVRPRTASDVIDFWMKNDKSKSILLGKSKAVGCSFSTCGPRWDQAVSVIYVCHYSK